MKKNIKKIPPFVKRRLAAFGINEIVAGCTRQFRLSEVQNGALSKYGIKIPAEGVAVGLQSEFEPPYSAGKYSRLNCRKLIVIHKDEPKVPREFERIIKDWHGNPHMIFYTRDCYRRSVIQPKHIKIQVEILRIELERVVVAFRVDEALQHNAPDFQERLLAGLNLLQENVRTCNVELASTEMKQYQHLLSVDWSIFPPGSLTALELARRMFGGAARRLDDKMLKLIQDRYDFLMSLGATAIIVGTDSFRGYIGAKMAGDIVVFDNVRFGNAVYILRERWEELSKKTKRELRKMLNVASRIQHNINWKKAVTRKLRALGISPGM